MRLCVLGLKEEVTHSISFLTCERSLPVEEKLEKFTNETAGGLKK
jgi:hypothetical protein